VQAAGIRCVTRVPTVVWRTMFQLPRLLRPGQNRRGLFSMLTLLAYAVTAVGVPMGGNQGVPSTECRCSNDLKSSGECCCRKAVSVIAESQSRHLGLGSGRSRCVRNAAQSHRRKSRAVKACCSSKNSELQPTNTNSCCVPGERLHCTPSGEPVANSDHNADADVPSYPTIAPCTCGNESSVGLMCNTDPRLPGDSVRVLPGEDWQKKWEFVCEFPLDDPIAPETPPPQVAA